MCKLSNSVCLGIALIWTRAFPATGARRPVATESTTAQVLTVHNRSVRDGEWQDEGAFPPPQHEPLSVATVPSWPIRGPGHSVVDGKAVAPEHNIPKRVWIYWQNSDGRDSTCCSGGRLSSLAGPNVGSLFERGGGITQEGSASCCPPTVKRCIQKVLDLHDPRVWHIVLVTPSSLGFIIDSGTVDGVKLDSGSVDGVKLGSGTVDGVKPSDNNDIAFPAESLELDSGKFGAEGYKRLNSTLLTSLKFPSGDQAQMGADFARLVILARFGGVWIDSTIWLLSSLDWVAKAADVASSRLQLPGEKATRDAPKVQSSELLSPAKPADDNSDESARSSHEHHHADSPEQSTTKSYGLSRDMLPPCGPRLVTGMLGAVWDNELNRTVERENQKGLRLATPSWIPVGTYPENFFLAASPRHPLLIRQAQLFASGYGPHRHDRDSQIDSQIKKKLKKLWQGIREVSFALTKADWPAHIDLRSPGYFLMHHSFTLAFLELFGPRDPSDSSPSGSSDSASPGTATTLSSGLIRLLSGIVFVDCWTSSGFGLDAPFADNGTINHGKTLAALTSTDRDQVESLRKRVAENEIFFIKWTSQHRMALDSKVDRREGPDEMPAGSFLGDEWNDLQNRYGQQWKPASSYFPSLVLALCLVFVAAACASSGGIARESCTCARAT